MEEISEDSWDSSNEPSTTSTKTGFDHNSTLPSVNQFLEIPQYGIPVKLEPASEDKSSKLDCVKPSNQLLENASLCKMEEGFTDVSIEHHIIKDEIFHSDDESDDDLIEEVISVERCSKPAKVKHEEAEETLFVGSANNMLMDSFIKEEEISSYSDAVSSFPSKVSLKYCNCYFTYPLDSYYHIHIYCIHKPC